MSKGKSVSKDKLVVNVKVFIDGKECYGQTRISTNFQRSFCGLSEQQVAIRAVESLLEKMKDEYAQANRSGAV